MFGPFSEARARRRSAGMPAFGRLGLRKARLAGRFLLAGAGFLVLAGFFTHIPLARNTGQAHLALDVNRLHQAALETWSEGREGLDNEGHARRAQDRLIQEEEQADRQEQLLGAGEDQTGAGDKIKVHRNGGKKKSKKKAKEVPVEVDEAFGHRQLSAEVKAEIQSIVNSSSRNTASREVFECDRSSPLTDVCTVKGDIRVDLQQQRTVLYAKGPDTSRGELLVRPHPRKWDYWVMNDVTQQKIQSIALEDDPAPLQCSRHHKAPAVLFSVGGYCGGVFHDFNEVFLPLFQTTHHYQKDVIFLVADLKGAWWWHGPPSKSFVGAMTMHPIRLLGADHDADGNPQEGVDCFDSLTVGLWHNLCMYDEFGGREMRSEQLAGTTVQQFAPFVADGLGLAGVNFAPIRVPKGVQPVLGLVQRLKTRNLINYDELLEAAERVGFRVTPIIFEHMAAPQIVRLMAQIDVLAGVHGAGLSNICLMRPGGVVLQMMPYGEWGGGRVVGWEYHNMAVKIGAHYLEWQVPMQDSTLVNTYNLTDSILLDPDRIWKEQHTLGAMGIYHAQNITMPADMFGAYLRHIRRDLHFRDKVLAANEKLQASLLNQ